LNAFDFDRSDKPLGIGVQVGGTRRQADDLDAGALQQISKCGGILRVPIEDDELLVRQEAIDGVGEIPAGFCVRNPGASGYSIVPPKCTG
jgi:hypothetical protein